MIYRKLCNSPNFEGLKAERDGFEFINSLNKKQSPAQTHAEAPLDTFNYYFITSTFPLICEYKTLSEPSKLLGFVTSHVRWWKSPLSCLACQALQSQIFSLGITAQRIPPDIKQTKKYVIAAFATRMVPTAGGGFVNREAENIFSGLPFRKDNKCRRRIELRECRSMTHACGTPPVAQSCVLLEKFPSYMTTDVPAASLPSSISQNDL